MIQRQFVSIFTMSDTEFGREQHHLKRSKFVFRRAIGSFQFFHHTGATACLVRVTGKVQGVWYRGWVCDEAVRREL